MKKKLLLLGICIELIAISYGAVQLFPIVRDLILRSRPVYAVTVPDAVIKSVSTNDLSYYYELKPDIRWVMKLPWGNSSSLASTNEFGRRGTERKKRDGMNILALGDSFTFGQYVNDGQEYPAILAGKLSRSCRSGTGLQVINGGVPGYDMQYAARYISLHVAEINPNLIIWLLKDDDFSDIQEITLNWKTKIERDAVASHTDQDLVKIYGIYYPEVLAGKKLHTTFSEQDLYEKSRQYFDALAASYSGELILATFETTSDKNKAFLRELAKTRPRTWVFDSLTYKKTDDWRYPDGHPTVLGHETIAGELYHYLTDNDFIRCTLLGE